MRQAHDGGPARTRRSLLRKRAPLLLGAMCATGGLALVSMPARAQVGSANVPLPNVMLLLDTSGSFEHMIDGTNPEDTGPTAINPNLTYGNNNTSVSPPLLANCELAAAAGVAAVPNRWGVAVQALTGTILNASGTPFYSCVTMDRATGPLATVNGVLNTQVASTVAQGDGLDIQYGLRDEAGNFFYPYDSGYYLPFHRPVSVTAGGGRCVYSPHVLPGASLGGVGISGGAPAANDCPNESGICWATDYPADSIGQFLYDTTPALPGQTGVPIPNGSMGIPATLNTPNMGYSSNTQPCSFNQASDGIIQQASTLVRFGLMTFDNDPSPDVGVQGAAPVIPMQLVTAPSVPPPFPPPAVLPAVIPPQGPFSGMWSYDSTWSAKCAAASTPPPFPFQSPSSGFPAQCGTPSWFELGARNSAAPPWEGRLLGFPNPNADVNAIGQSNLLVQTSISAMRPYGATPTGALMADAEYYFWGDPSGPNVHNSTPDPYVAGGCRAQYIILLTDGAPNQDLRTGCQGTGALGSVAAGVCPYQLPEDTASVLATATPDVQTGLSPGANGNVYTYVIGFAVSGNTNGNVAGTEAGTANCAALAASGALAATCGTGNPYSPTDTSTSTITPLTQQQNLSTTAVTESPCCSLQRIAVAGGTQHAYFADTPGDLNAALAAVLGDITGQLGSRTLPVAAPTISYAATGPLTATFLSTFQAATCPNLSATGQCLGPWQSSGPWMGDVQRQQYTCAGGAAAASPPVTSDDFSADLATQPSRNFLFFNGWNSGTTTSTNALTLRPYLNTNHIISSYNPGSIPPADNLDSFAANGQTGQEISNFGGGVNPLYTAFNPSISIALNIQPTSCEDPFTAQYLDTGSCGNLALSFAMGQSSFPTATSSPAALDLANAYQNGHDGANTVPVTNRSGTVTTPTGAIVSQAFGAILDSTPSIIAVPSAQVRDDSYQAFSRALSTGVLSAAGHTTRDTMLYVATIDGLLHAFDTGAGITGTAGTSISASQVEAWSFIPPAVLPNLISNYPGASHVLLDGAPVVKDVVFSRCATPGAICGSPPSSQWVQDWHTMLVAGFGLGGRGYYALDVTDPRPPTAPLPPTFATPNYPSFVASGAPAVLSGTGPHFQWQITNVNLSGTSTAASLGSSFVPNELFGKISGTPAIATVYADPTLPSPGSTTYPQEIGIAILPGGHDGLPTAGLVCPRELEVNAGNYTTHAPLYINAGLSGNGASVTTQSPFNVSDTKFPPRKAVRGWAQTCGNVPGQLNSAVAGRSVMVVSVATGQVLAVFARAPSQNFLTSQSASAWDVPSDGKGNALIGNGATGAGANPFLNYTPLDSPMTGRPVVYPSGVGVVAQAAYIGDADGTMWRFDLSDPNPRNWTGAIFADAYSPVADLAGGDAYPLGSATDWTALDSEGITVEPQLALDATANVTMNFATGDQTAFNACYSATGTTGGDVNTNGTCLSPLQPTVNFVYSVKELRHVTGGAGIPPYTASVNWYQEWTTGERVTGPMAIFNGILYFATYVPPGGSSTGCAGGGANLYAWDFAKPATCSGSNGGNNASNAVGDTTLPVGYGGVGNVDPNFAPTGQLNYSALQGQNPSITVNTIIPGVSIASTPSCATTSVNPAGDAYSGAAHTTIANPTPPTYSLMANIGKGKKSTAQNLVTQKLAAPTAPTIVDSWAAVSE